MRRHRLRLPPPRKRPRPPRPRQGRLPGGPPARRGRGPPSNSAGLPAWLPDSTFPEKVLWSRARWVLSESLPPPFSPPVFEDSHAMALSSMTGFARSHGASGPYTFEWELKSVNAKGFDLRLRLPPGWDELEAHAKKRAGDLLARGTVYANFNVKRANALSAVRINEDVLASVVKVAGELAGKIDAVAP